MTVFGEKGVYLDSTLFGSKDRHQLIPGEYEFYTSLVADTPWAILVDKPTYGILLERLETLDKDPRGILEAATKDGKRFFKHGAAR